MRDEWLASSQGGRGEDTEEGRWSIDGYIGYKSNREQ